MTADLRVTSGSIPQTVVHFQVITNHIIPTLASHDSLGVVGNISPLNWGPGPYYRMHKASSDSVWDCEAVFDSTHTGETLRYNFAVERYGGESDWENQIGNRTLVLAGNTMNLPPVYFNNDSTTVPNHLPTVLSFRVITNHIIPPLLSTDSLALRGSLRPLTWSSSYRIANIDSGSIWEGAVAFDSACGGGILQFKFVVDHMDGSLW